MLTSNIYFIIMYINNLVTCWALNNYISNFQGNFKHTSSARRIKKEIRNKRTSFLGIEGQTDDYLDADLTSPRPDITSFLQEETKIEKLLYKKTLSHDNAKLRDSRDSGVDVDRGPSAEAWYKQSSPETSNPHSRQNSEVILWPTAYSLIHFWNIS